MSLDGDGWMDSEAEGPGYHFTPPDEIPDTIPFVEMSGRALRRIIERLDPEILALALRDAEAREVDRFLRNVSPKNAVHIREEIERAGAEESERRAEARLILKQTAYSMKKRGEITFEGPADDAIPRWIGSSRNCSPRFTPPRARPNKRFRWSSPWPPGRSSSACSLSNPSWREARTGFSPSVFGCWWTRCAGTRPR